MIEEFQYESTDDATTPRDTPSEHNLKNVLAILEQEPTYESPIDINLSRTIPVNIAPPLNWINFELPPKKMKITNTGHTVILSGKWGQERPYITNGVLSGKYVFSQMHLHWGVNDMEGSEHTIDNCYYPAELHVVLFKSCYLTQESALKEKDGVIILVYMLKLQDELNPLFSPIINALPAVAKAHTSQKIKPMELNLIIRQFESDYYMYKGSMSTKDCLHQIHWLITRVPIGVSCDQTDSLRFLLDNNDELIRRNFRPVQSNEDRHVFHIMPSSSKYSTLLPLLGLEAAEKTVTQIYRVQVLFNRMEKGKKQDKTLQTEERHFIDTNLSVLVDEFTWIASDASVLRKYMNLIYPVVFVPRDSEMINLK